MKKCIIILIIYLIFVIFFCLENSFFFVRFHLDMLSFLVMSFYLYVFIYILYLLIIWSEFLALITFIFFLTLFFILIVSENFLNGEEIVFYLPLSDLIFYRKWTDVEKYNLAVDVYRECFLYYKFSLPSIYKCETTLFVILENAHTKTEIINTSKVYFENIYSDYHFYDNFSSFFQWFVLSFNKYVVPIVSSKSFRYAFPLYQLYDWWYNGILYLALTGDPIFWNSWFFRRWILLHIFFQILQLFW